MKKKFFLVLVLIFAQILPVSAFVDVPESDPQFSIFAHLNDTGVLRVFPDGNIYPSQIVTRAEALAIALRAGGIVIPADFEGEVLFSDVDPNAWYAPVVKRGIETRLISKSQDTFRPEQAISKAEYLAMLFRATKVDFRPYYSRTKGIAKDIPEDAWYAPHFAYAKKYQIAQFPANENYLPFQILTRRSIAMITYRQLRLFYGDEVSKIFAELQAKIDLFLTYLHLEEEDKATMQLQRIVELTNSLSRVQNNEDALAATAISLAMSYFSDSLQSFRYNNYLKALEYLFLSQKQARRVLGNSETITPFAEKLMELIEETLSSFEY